MDQKISLESIAQYGDTYSERVLNDFFSNKAKISGPEILKLSDIQQVNWFVVGELFKNWKGETKKIRSPYFDYENPEVKEALEALMEKLSNHISIDKTHFAPLFRQAVRQTLLAVFDPYDFFSLIISGENNKLQVSPFREELRYLKVNKAPLERLLQRLEEKSVNEISGNEAFAILDQILEEVNFNPEDVDVYLEKFSAVVPLDASKFFVDKNQSASLKPSVEERKSEPKFEAQQQAPITTSSQQPVKSSVNDIHNRQGKPSLADNFQKIAKIKDSLTINQKFMFTKVLFHGDFELFSKAIEHLDRQDNMKGALRYIEEEHASTWDRDSEEFHEFMELIEKRFA